MMACTVMDGFGWPPGLVNYERAEAAIAQAWPQVAQPLLEACRPPHDAIVREVKAARDAACARRKAERAARHRATTSTGQEALGTTIGLPGDYSMGENNDHERCICRRD